MIFVSGCILFTLQSTAQLTNTSQHTEVVLKSEVRWEPLNPARGDRSPQAGTLWGDRNETEATGFLVRFKDGFSSPPHIHNVTYRAVVISGYIHNDDPDAAKMWMSPGSFWTQPKGEVHITAAKGSGNMALVEINEGPYLVLDPDEAFDDGERPVNVDVSNIVWVDPPGFKPSDKGPKLAYLWGNLKKGCLNGSFIRFPAGFTGEIHSEGLTFRAVVIDGQPSYLGEDTQVLVSGSYFGSDGSSIHRLSSKPDEESILYISTNGPYRIVSLKAE